MKDYTYDAAKAKPMEPKPPSKPKSSYFAGAFRAPKEAMHAMKKGFRRLSMDDKEAMIWKDANGGAVLD